MEKYHISLFLVSGGEATVLARAGWLENECEYESGSAFWYEFLKYLKRF